MLRRLPVRPSVGRVASASTRPLLARTLIAQPPHLPNNAPASPLPTRIRQTDPETKAAAENMKNLVANLNELRAKAREGGGKKSLEKWKSKGVGKLGARER